MRPLRKKRRKMVKARRRRLSPNTSARPRQMKRLRRIKASSRVARPPLAVRRLRGRYACFDEPDRRGPGIACALLRKKRRKMVKAAAGRSRLSPNTSARPPARSKRLRRIEASSPRRPASPRSPSPPGKDTHASTNLTGEVLGSHAPSPEETPQDGQSAAPSIIAEHFGAPAPDEAPSENRGVEPASPGLPSQSVASGEDTHASTNLTGEVLGSHAPSPEETPQDGQSAAPSIIAEHFGAPAPDEAPSENRGVDPASPGLPQQSVASGKERMLRRT